MPAQTVAKDDRYVLNHCTRFLARSVIDPRHNFGQYAAGDQRATISEAWRFPIVDSSPDYGFNDVTFIYDGRRAPATDVRVVGTFAPLYDQTPLEPVRFLDEETGYHAVTIQLCKGQVHTYKFVIDGVPTVDPINPQTTALDNGQMWSRFITDACQQPVFLTRRERDLLGQIVAHILPFRLEENSVFIKEIYNMLDRQQRDERFPLAYRLDEEVGVVNYIDKLLVRAEQHNADDYRTCLRIIDRILRARFGGVDPVLAPPELYTDLYAQMERSSSRQTSAVDGWDYDAYDNPQYFLVLLRRHAMTGAFTHPKTGGNSGAAGWMYLESRYRDANDHTLFDWRQAIEAPLGRNTDYRG
jgi:hypothetical protein